MPKSEFCLQLAIFGMTAALVALFVAKLYPAKIFAKDTSNPLPNLVQAQLKTNESPTAISIPSLNLNLTVAPGIIVDNQWTLYDDKVSWLSTSKIPGKGNVILYAHNRENLFALLKEVKNGDEITIQHEGKLKVYKIAEKHKVSPDDVDKIISEKDQLTLYTCDGSFDQKRLVVIAYPKS